MRRPKLLLFDLGGVLVDFTGVDDLGPLLRVPLSASDIRRRWIACPTTRAFEVGAVTPTEFAERFVREWGVTLTPVEFLREYRSWTRGFLPGAREVLAALQGRTRLACLSNSNEMHWERNAELGIFEPFEVALSSHALGSYKPEPVIYRRALAILRLAAEDVVFFDDSAANADAARQVGLVAYQVKGVAELRARLDGLGFLREG